jgi:hypothetical protein
VGARGRACRVERLKLLARTSPNLAADLEFSEIEPHALVLLKRRSKKKKKDEGDPRGAAPGGAPARSGDHRRGRLARRGRAGDAATKAEVPKLRRFFAMYRGTAQTEDVAFAVARVGEALLAADPKDGRTLVEAAAKDPMTVDVAQKRLQALLAASPVEKGNPKKPDAKKPDAPEDKAAGKK